MPTLFQFFFRKPKSFTPYPASVDPYQPRVFEETEERQDLVIQNSQISGILDLIDGKKLFSCHSAII